MNKKYENYLKTMENLPKEIEDLLKKQGKEATEFIIKKWDTQYEFVNQEVELRKRELRNIILSYCQLHFMTLPEVQEVTKEIEEIFYRRAFLIDKFKEAE